MNIDPQGSDVKSFKYMMQSIISNMRFSPREATWHTLNHYLPCIGIRSYSYNTSESLQLCDAIEKQLNNMTELLCDDIFLVGKTKTSEMINEQINRESKRKRRVPIREESRREWVQIPVDVHETIQTIHTNDEEECFDTECDSQDSEVDAVHQADEQWLNDEEIAELNRVQEKHILNKCEIHDDEW